MNEGGTRRVVTGTSTDGRSVIWQDGGAPRRLETSPGGIVLNELWSTDGGRQDPTSSADPAAGAVSIAPPPRGTVFRTVVYPPDATYLEGWDPAAAWRAMGGQEPSGAGPQESLRHPGFHRTRSVDYIVVIEGEIWALMEDGEVLLRQGDCLVQRGTNHAWSNRSDRRAVLAAVLVDNSDA